MYGLKNTIAFLHYDKKTVWRHLNMANLRRSHCVGGATSCLVLGPIRFVVDSVAPRHVCLDLFVVLGRIRFVVDSVVPRLGPIRFAVDFVAVVFHSIVIDCCAGN